MTLAPQISQHYPDLSETQRQIIGHIDGPLLVIAGPGSGKTYSIVLRALNLLLLGKAKQNEIVLCTFTEKAAFEMRDRLAAAARKVGYAGDLSELSASTIHSFCNRILSQNRHRTDLGQGYDTLDELTQLLFIFEHFDAIIGPAANDLFLHRWKTRWTAIEGARTYFDKITEELVDPGRLVGSADPFLRDLGDSYQRYERALVSANRTDFAHLQRIVFDLLHDPTAVGAVTHGLRYVLVDEYQDTNYIQEQLLLKLTENSRNLCVVGDEDKVSIDSGARLSETFSSFHNGSQTAAYSSSRPITDLTAPSSSAITAGWRQRTGRIRAALPFGLTRPFVLIPMLRTPSTQPRLRFGGGISEMKPSVLQIWLNFSRRPASSLTTAKLRSCFTVFARITAPLTSRPYKRTEFLRSARALVPTSIYRRYET